MFWILLTLIALGSPANAADFTFVANGISYTQGANEEAPVCNMRMNGPVTAGDTERFKAAMLDANRKRNGSSQVNMDAYFVGLTVCLNSPGGAYSEGLAIAKFILDNEIQTMIEGEALC